MGVINQTINGSITATQATLEDPDGYDPQGAMQYIVAVVLVYGVGVLGVFILSFFGRRRKKYSREMDNQANYYLKNMRKSRDFVIKEERRAAVQNFVTPRIRDKLNQNARILDIGKGLIGVVGIPLLVHEQTCDVTNGTDAPGKRGPKDSGYDTCTTGSMEAFMNISQINRMPLQAQDSLPDDVFDNTEVQKNENDSLIGS